MKKIIFTFCACIALAAASCSSDPMDATSKHVYGANENPYLKTNVAATVATSLDFAVGHFAPQTIALADYASYFTDNMGMTVDEVLAGLSNGSVVFYNINATRNHWDKTPPTKGSTGWWYNSAGGITSEGEGLISVDIDAAARALVVNAKESAPAGTSFTFNVGFAVDNGRDFDNYVRFSVSIAVTDMSKIIVSCAIPAGDYASYGIDFAKYQEAIETCMGMTLAEFDAAGNSPATTNIALYMVDLNTLAWDKTSAYTANGLGFWVTPDNVVTGWGSDSAFFVETYPGGVSIGRYPGLASGTQYRTRFVYAVMGDDEHYIEFIVTATLD
jgi:hypothetical protein